MAGSAPAAVFQARHASTKVISCPLSSEAPRPTMRFTPFDDVDARLEGRALPFAERIDRLDVVVAVEEHVRAARCRMVVGDDHRVAVGRAHRGVETETRQLARQPLRRRAHAVAIGRIGGDALDPQEREQPLQARRKVVINLFQDAVEHGLSSVMACRHRSGIGRASEAAGLCFRDECGDMRGETRSMRGDDGRACCENSCRHRDRSGRRPHIRDRYPQVPAPRGADRTRSMP